VDSGSVKREAVATVWDLESKSPEETGLCYLDGLVSAGKEFPSTILKTFFTTRKKTGKYFINIEVHRCGLSKLRVHRFFFLIGVFDCASLFRDMMGGCIQTFGCESRRDDESFNFVGINPST
jgi:hypothetical protein